MKKGVFILCLAICLLFTVSSVCAGDVNDTIVASDENQVIGEANDEEVMASSQNEDVLGDNVGTFTDLQNKINNATGSTITLDKDYAYDDGFDTEGITIQKDLTINGNGHTLDGLSKSRIFHMGFQGSSVAQYTVILNNINFKNGRADEGGAIQAVSSWYYPWQVNQDRIYQYYILKVNNCLFTGNVASGGSGGAISSEGDLTLTNSIFKNNVASKRGGGVYSHVSELNKCTFTANSAKDGGAVYIIGDSEIEYFDENKNSKVYSCTFNLNKASGDGGAVYVDTPNVLIMDAKFTSNSAKGEGGAIYAWGNDRIYSTMANHLNVKKCTFKGNSAKNGGAIRLFGESYVSYCTFTGNAAGNGGAIYAYDGISQINYCTFNSNKASGNGGAIYVTKDRILISYSEFTGNSAKGKGGAIYNNYNNKSGALKCTFSKNKAGAYDDLYGVGTAKCVFLKTKLTLKTVKVKKSAKKLVLTATLKSGKSPLKGKKISFKFNGKKYKAKTNKKGIAKVTLKKKILKKLKVGKKVKYQASYGKITIKKTVKIKK